MKKCVVLACAAVLCSSFLMAGCSSNQTIKNAWKGTKGVWYTYMSPPASIDYEDKSTLDAQELLLTTSMIGIDVQLGQLERVMSNADKPPTAEWIAALFARFPWLDGFAGVKADGTIIGQEPSAPVKPLDFSPLLEEDSKQNSRALRGYVQDTPMGPEVFLAAPLYDGEEFLGVVVAYFDMRNLIGYSTNANELIILSPQATLWSGQYDYAATPLSGLKWEEVLRSNTKGTVSAGNQNFYWMARYLGNQPLIFASSATDKTIKELEKSEDPSTIAPLPALEGGVGAMQTQNVGSMEVVKEGSPEDAVLTPQELEQKMQQQRAAEQRKEQLRQQRAMRQAQQRRAAQDPDARRRANIDVSPLGNSGSRDEDFERPSPFGPRRDAATPDEKPAGDSAQEPQATSAPQEDSAPVMTRPSPFGPKRDTPKEEAPQQEAPAEKAE